MKDLERYEYQDEGCDLFPSCLHCPLSQCRYDEPRRQQMRKELRNKEIVRLHQKEGLKVEELATRFGVNKRTVHRILASRNGEGGVQRGLPSGGGVRYE